MITFTIKFDKQLLGKFYSPNKPFPEVVLNCANTMGIDFDIYSMGDIRRKNVGHTPYMIVGTKSFDNDTDAVLFKLKYSDYILEE